MFVKSAVTWKDKASLLDIATTTLKNANTHIAGLFCILNMFGLASLVEKLSAGIGAYFRTTFTCSTILE